MPKFSIQNTEAKISSRDVKYQLTTPNAFMLATNFDSPYIITLVANEPYDIYCDKVLNQNNFFNPGEFIPQISGNYLVRWSFACLLASGTPAQTYTGTVRSINTETFNFIPSNSVTTTNNFHTIISTVGFSYGEGGVGMHFTITSPVNATLHLTSNIINIKYASALNEEALL